MAKNIQITIDNSLTGTVELFASAPTANGVHQTAPPFSQFEKYTNGTVTLTDVPETPDDRSWHYRIIVRPKGNTCGSAEGSAQYRVFLPASSPATVSLTELPLAWAWTQNGTNYAWLGTPNNSSSVKMLDGVEVARNIAPDPKALNPANFRSTGTLSAETVEGVQCTKITAPSNASMQIVVDKRVYATEEGFQVGDTVYWSADVRVTTPEDIQMIVLPYVGGNEDTEASVTSQVPEDGWVRHYGVSTITAAPAGSFFNYRIHTVNASVPAGLGFYFRNLMIQKNTQEPYFDGDS